MLKFKNGKMYYEFNGDSIVLMSNTTGIKVNDFEVYLKKVYGNIPSLTEIKHEIIYFF